MTGHGKVWAATALLVVGVTLSSATAETGVIWWGVGGLLCLLFVPALIFDAAVDMMKSSRHEGAAMSGPEDKAETARWEAEKRDR